MKLGICLSGGGVKGVAHLGILQYLIENEIDPEIISGTSAGAIVGAFYARGIPPKEILKVFKEINIFRIPHLAIGRAGIFNLYRLRTQLEPYFPKGDFTDLKKELHIHTTNLMSGGEEVFTTGDLIKSVFASSAIPFIFAPVEIKEMLYTDGGVCNNFPIESIRKRCELLIGINVEGVTNKNQKDLGNTIRVIERAMEILIDKSSREKSGECDIYIDFPELSKYSILDFSKMDEIFKIGYEKAGQFKDEFQRLKQLISAV
jgi:NTE family protein